MEQGQADGALRQAEAILQEDPQNNEIRQLVGRAMLAAGDGERARDLMLPVAESLISASDLIGAQTMLQELLKTLPHDAGVLAMCVKAYAPSGDEEMLRRVNKDITLEQVREAIRLTKKHGIRSLGFFLIGSPGETRATIRKTLKFAKSLSLDYVQFSKTTAKPLTRMWRDMVAETGRDYWREYILGNTEEQPLPRPWTELTNDEIDELARRAYVKFHARPWFLLKHTLKVRSWAEFKRKFFAFWDMMLKQERVSKADGAFKCYGEDKGKLNWYKKISKWSQPF